MVGSGRNGEFVLAVLAAMGLASSACMVDSDTYVCDSGRRCPSGQICAANQDVCIDMGGCGDGIVDVTREEVCDDGNIEDRDGCSSDCKSQEICGNGIQDAAAGETCDDGDTVGGDGCSATCQLEQCGNNIVDLAAGEVCDDGNQISGDGCRHDCQSNEMCGNGIVDQADGADGSPVLTEECDPGKGGWNTGSCNADCTFARCGDGYWNPELMVLPENGGEPYPEQCDTEGNSIFCDEDCTLAECGDGFINPEAGEECDDRGADPDACTEFCTLPTCGDGMYHPSEVCDTRGNTQICDADCSLPECGDGHHNPEFIIDAESNATEECDDGELNSDDTANACRTDCREPWCGDGVTDDERGETCDDGDNDVSDACPSGPGRPCRQAVCGDGFVRAGVEQCDPGSAAPRGGCSLNLVCLGPGLPLQCFCASP